MSTRKGAPCGIRKGHGDPWAGVSYLVCLGRDLWKELVGVVEAEAWGSSPAVEDPVHEVAQPPLDEALPEGDDDSGPLGYTRVSIRSEGRYRRWATAWDEDTIWGDPDRETRRRLDRLLGGA